MKKLPTTGSHILLKQLSVWSVCLKNKHGDKLSCLYVLFFSSLSCLQLCYCHFVQLVLFCYHFSKHTITLTNMYQFNKCFAFVYHIVVFSTVHIICILLHTLSLPPLYHSPSPPSLSLSLFLSISSLSLNRSLFFLPSLNSLLSVVFDNVCFGQSTLKLETVQNHTQ